MLVSPAWRMIYNYLLILLFVISVSAIFASFSVATFVVTLNPGAKRHWRHMTFGVYVVLLSEILAYIFLLCSGATIADMAFAFGPLVVGAGALLCVVAMRKSEIKKIDIEKGS
jgi:hypothetical protein